MILNSTPLLMVRLWHVSIYIPSGHKNDYRVQYAYIGSYITINQVHDLRMTDNSRKIAIPCVTPLSKSTINDWLTKHHMTSDSKWEDGFTVQWTVEFSVAECVRKPVITAESLIDLAVYRCLSEFKSQCRC